MAVKQRTDLSRGLDALTDPGRVILARRRVPRKRRKTRRNLAAVRGELAVCYSLGCFRSIRGMLDKEPADTDHGHTEVHKRPKSTRV